MKGHRLAHGIWNKEHHIMSRDVAHNEVYRTEKEAKARLIELLQGYQCMGYELWFSETKKIEVWECGCGKVAEKGCSCWYCGKNEAKK